MNIGKFNFEFKPLPHVWWETNLPKEKSGTANFFVIRLDKERSDESTYQHELMHLKQAYVVNGIGALLFYLIHPPMAFLGLAMYALLYTASQRFRFEMEAMAFATSAEYKSFPKDPDRWIKSYAESMTKNYDLDVRRFGQNCIYKRIREYWDRFYK